MIVMELMTDDMTFMFNYHYFDGNDDMIVVLNHYDCDGIDD